MKLKDKMVRWLAMRLPTCKEVTRMASDSMERKLPLRRRHEMKQHLMFCALCTRYVKQLRFMHDAVQQHAAEIETGAAAPPSVLSNDARERMKQRLRA
jgi:tRNA A37 threonylcarbamoyltransferase TsaD